MAEKAGEMFKKFFSIKNRTVRFTGIILSAIVVFSTTYALVLPALTIENENATPEAGFFIESEDTSSEAGLIAENEDVSSEADPAASSEEAAPEADPIAENEIIKAEPVSGNEAAEEGNNTNDGAVTDTSADNSYVSEYSDNGMADAQNGAQETISPDSYYEESVLDGNTSENDSEMIAEPAALPETELPAAVLYAETNPLGTDNITVTVNADEGAFPEGSEVTAVDVSGDEYINGVMQNIYPELANTTDEAGNAQADTAYGIASGMQAVNISFSDSEGYVTEPAVPVWITIGSGMIESAYETLLYFVPDPTRPG